MGLKWKKAMERSAYVPTRKLLMALEYNGAAFRGLQADVSQETQELKKTKAIQKPSIETALMKAYYKVSKGYDLERVGFASRTESGVSATFNVAEGSVNRTMTEKSVVRDFLYPMNLFFMSHFPVRIMAVACVGDEFSTSRMASSRTYRHTIRVVPSHHACSLDHFHKCWYHICSHRLDVEKMNRAAELVFLGRHALSSFTTPEQVASLSSPVVSISSIQVQEADQPSGLFSRYGEEQLIHIDVTGDHFLPRQMERMASALVAVGRGELTMDELHDLRNSVDPDMVAAIPYTAPRHATWVTNIEFRGQEVEWIFPDHRMVFQERKPETIVVPPAGEQPASPQPGGTDSKSYTMPDDADGTPV